MCIGFEVGSYLRLTDSCVAQLQAHGPSRTCKEEEEGSSSQGLEIEPFLVWQKRIRLSARAKRTSPRGVGELQGYFAHQKLPPPLGPP